MKRPPLMWADARELGTLVFLIAFLLAASLEIVAIGILWWVFIGFCVLAFLEMGVQQLVGMRRRVLRRNRPKPPEKKI